jgi:ABC-type multidrug transport system ATPase subunit
MPLLQVQSVGVRAGRRFIVEDLTFTVRTGEITAVIGPNGSGKTTLLEAMVGLRRADTGSVELDGHPLRTFAERAKTFAFLPDAGVLPPEARVRTVVDHARSLAQRTADVDALGDELALAPLAEKPVAVLSRGEHQRVALYCTLLLGRPVVVLDEAFSAFDPLQLVKVFAGVRRVASAGAAVVASFHQLADAQKLADRFLLIARGRAVAFGDLAFLHARAQTSGSLEDAFVSLLSRMDDAP